MSDTRILPTIDAMELMQEIPVVFARLLDFYDADVEYVKIGVEDGKIVVKSNPTSSQVHVDSIMGEELEKEAELRYTFSPWYVPESLDAHSEWTDRREVQQAFWNYLADDNRVIRLQHNLDVIAGEWVEGATWPFEVTVPVKHPDGDTEYTFPAGTPFLGVIWEPWAWELIKSGEIRGLSIGGTANRAEAELVLDKETNPSGPVEFSKEFTQAPFVKILDLDKHLQGKHDQSSHGKGSGKYPKVKDVPASPERSPAAVSAAIKLRAAANARSEEITDTMTGIADEFGGEMRGLENRVKSTDSLARKIDADAKAEHGGDTEKAAAAISDASRYTMVLNDSNYTAGLASLRDKLAADGYEVRTKNFWQEGDPYQGVNMKLTKDGVTSELQLHTKKSLEIKETQLHPVYENYRIATDPAVRRSLYNDMVAIAASIPRPADYEALVAIGTPAFQAFTS